MLLSREPFVFQLVSVFIIVFLLAMLAWPSVAPRLKSLRRKRGRRVRRYFQN
jgi:membrane protein implicated in regulation of membrane protease activity